MKTNDIIIRDPFVLFDNGKYYLYGTRSQTAWKTGTGFDVFVSDNLEDWRGPIEIFHRPDNFWADKEFWAPECRKKDGKYYLIATFGKEDGLKRIQILFSDSPEGPFSPLTDDAITPVDWNCLDGTIFTDKLGNSWLIFSHSFPQEPKGAIVTAQLSKDMKTLITTPKTLFHAADVPWTQAIPFAQKEFGLDGENYFSDGPYLFYNKAQELCMLWSSWSANGYAMGISVSESGEILGPWIHSEKAIYHGGGHGMVFPANEQTSYVVWHTPNEFMKEHPIFMSLDEFISKQ